MSPHLSPEAAASPNRAGKDGSTENTSRTHVEYSSSTPTFDSNFSFVVFDAGQVFKIDLVDASVDKVLGCLVLGAQDLLQFQRDLYVKDAGSVAHGGLFLNTFTTIFKPPTFELGDGDGNALRRMAFFRVGSSGASYKSKDIYSVGFFNKGFTSRPQSAGFLDFEACLKENSTLIYDLQNPPPMNQRLDEDFNVDITRLQVLRLQRIIGKIQRWWENYLHMVSWADPKLSLSCFVALVYVCLRINMDFIGCVPPSMPMVNMIIKYRRRSNGLYVEKHEEEELVKIRKKAEQSNGVHRPVAQVKIAIPRGKHLRSRDLGLPGNVYATASWSQNVEGKGTEYEVRLWRRTRCQVLARASFPFV